MNKPNNIELDGMFRLIERTKPEDGMPTLTLEQLIELGIKSYLFDRYEPAIWRDTLKKHRRSNNVECIKST